MLKTELHVGGRAQHQRLPRRGRGVQGAPRQRGAAAEIAEENDLVIAAAGAHPLARPEDLVIVPEQRYHPFVEYAGVSLSPGRERPAHPRRDARSRGGTVLDGGFSAGSRSVLALSANSPYSEW